MVAAMRDLVLHGQRIEHLAAPGDKLFAGAIVQRAQHLAEHKLIGKTVGGKQIKPALDFIHPPVIADFCAVAA